MYHYVPRSMIRISAAESESEIVRGLAELDRLADDPDPERAAIRVGRLVGVLLKARFATSHELAAASVYTSAFRSWTLVDEAEFAAAARVDTWQYRTLVAIREELIEKLPRRPRSPPTLSTTNQAWGITAPGCGRQLCDIPQHPAAAVAAKFSACQRGTPYPADPCLYFYPRSRG